MPLSVFQLLGRGDPRPTTVVLQLVDRSLLIPEGVIEDELIQVGMFIFPSNFIIIDYEPNQKFMFILGWRFLDTDRVIVDVFEDQMTMRMGDRVEVFNVYRELKLQSHYEDLAIITVVDENAARIALYIIMEGLLNRALLGDKRSVKTC